MRKLIVVRIVHAPSDMGSAGEGLEKNGISTMGKQAWEENQKKIERFWQELETEVDGLYPLPALGSLGWEDQEFILEITGEILTALGYQVVKAEDGQKAIDLFKLAKRCGEPFDIIILDLTIPGGMGGKEAMQKIRALDANVKSIVSSGYSNDPVMSDPGKFGFTGVVSKPYTVRELQAEIHRVFQAGAS